MAVSPRPRLVSLVSAALVLLSSAACAHTSSPVTPTTTPTTPSLVPTKTSAPTPSDSPVPLPTSRTVKWVDLNVGDCITEVPAVDLGAVTATIVDCATPHQAEIYLLAPIAVNAAITDVANQECTAGLAPYTGRPAGAEFSMTYLIDSRQDRTSDNPLPSTVICLLQATGGQPLTSSAKR